MVVKIHVDGANRRRLIVRGRDVPFPGEPGPYTFGWGWD